MARWVSQSAGESHTRAARRSEVRESSPAHPGVELALRREVLQDEGAIALEGRDLLARQHAVGVAACSLPLRVRTRAGR